MHSDECKLVSGLLRSGYYTSEIRKHERAVNPSTAFTDFVMYMLSEGARLCSPGALARFQSQVFVRASWKLESSNELWQKFVELIGNLLEQSCATQNGQETLSKDEKFARDLKASLAAFKNHKLEMKRTSQNFPNNRSSSTSAICLGCLQTNS